MTKTNKIEKRVFNRKVQFIWWGYWIGLRIYKWEDAYNYRILDFSINCAYFEIRVWLPENKLKEQK